MLEHIFRSFLTGGRFQHHFTNVKLECNVKFGKTQFSVPTKFLVQRQQENITVVVLMAPTTSTSLGYYCRFAFTAEISASIMRRYSPGASALNALSSPKPRPHRCRMN